MQWWFNLLLLRNETWRIGWLYRIKRSILSTDSFVNLVTLWDLILTHKRLTILGNANVLKWTINEWTIIWIITQHWLSGTRPGGIVTLVSITGLVTTGSPSSAAAICPGTMWTLSSVSTSVTWSTGATSAASSGASTGVSTGVSTGALTGTSAGVSTGVWTGVSTGAEAGAVAGVAASFSLRLAKS